MKKIVKSFLKEIVPIILGILIALYINNWNESSKDEKYLKKMLSSLNKELTETNDEINEKIPFQNTLIDTLQFYKSNDEISIFDIMMKVNGVQIASIKTSSWKAISSSKIEMMKYDKVSALTKIEEQKELLLSKTQLLMNFIYPNVKDSGIDSKELVILMMQDIIVTEKAIKEEIDGIIEN